MFGFLYNAIEECFESKFINVVGSDIKKSPFNHARKKGVIYISMQLLKILFKGFDKIFNINQKLLNVWFIHAIIQKDKIFAGQTNHKYSPKC